MLHYFQKLKYLIIFSNFAEKLFQFDVFKLLDRLCWTFHFSHLNWAFCTEHYHLIADATELNLAKINWHYSSALLNAWIQPLNTESALTNCKFYCLHISGLHNKKITVLYILTLYIKSNKKWYFCICPCYQELTNFFLNIQITKNGKT